MKPIEESEILGMVKKSMQFPYSKVCIDLVALDLLSLLESHDCNISTDLIKAISDCDNEKALLLLEKN